MRIGEVAALAGLPAKTIRYYEDIGLVRSAIRTERGYRAYGERDLHILRFVQRARALGFSLADCRTLLALYEDAGRASADVKKIALAHLDAIDRKLAALKSLRDTLQRLADHCHGDDRPDCPILDELSDPASLTASRDP